MPENNTAKAKKDLQKKPKKLEWEELDNYVGKPVWENKKKIWRILNSYKRVGETFAVSFSDVTNWIDFKDVSLHLEEVE